MKPFIIPVFIPIYGCPNKCIYCDQNISIGQQSLPTPNDVASIVDEHLKTASFHSKPRRYTQVAFYGGTFTGLSFNTQGNYLKTIAPYLKNKKVQSIRLSTRPDYINQQNLNLLKSFSVKTIELGVQSMDDEVLKLSQRGYTSQKVEESARLIKENGLELGIQLMPGLPGDTENKIIKTSEQICKIKPDFLRIYPTVVIKNTLLQKLYLKGVYTTLSLKQAISICKKMLLLFQYNHIPVIRIGIQPTKTLLKPGAIVAGPFHPAFRELVLSSILYDRLFVSIKKNLTLKTFTFFVHPSELSTFMGNKKENVKKLKEEFPGYDIRFQQDGRVQYGNFQFSNI
jgi:histone acetyltransferase (RNA polymerase elongator complex component)